MSRLVKQLGNEIIVAHYRVAAPGYTLYAADVVADGHVQDGWNGFVEDVEPADFAAPWVQPTGAEDAYPMDAVVNHAGSNWRSMIVANVWEPGVSGWVDVSSYMPAWIQPTGAHDAYAVDAVVSHNAKVWRSLLDANVWQPGVSGWRETLRTLEPAPPPAWVQPTGAHDAYQIGDRVTHNDQVWVSTVADNVWEPGVFGWTVE